MQSEVSVKRVLCISTEGQKYPWHVENTSTVMGVEFVPLKLRDSGFCRFLCGSSFRSFKKDETKHFGAFIRQLSMQRSAATAAAMGMTATLTTPLGEVELTSRAKKRMRADVKSKAADGGMPEVVTIECERVELLDGTVSGPITIKAIASLDVRDAPAVEIDCAVLRHIRTAMVAALEQDNEDENCIARAIQSRGDCVRWRQSRKSWVAVRPGCNKMKAFKPEHIESHSAMKEAYDMAHRWATGEELADTGGVLTEATEHVIQDFAAPNSDDEATPDEVDVDGLQPDDEGERGHGIDEDGLQPIDADRVHCM